MFFSRDYTPGLDTCKVIKQRKIIRLNQWLCVNCLFGAEGCLFLEVLVKEKKIKTMDLIETTSSTIRKPSFAKEEYHERVVNITNPVTHSDGWLHTGNPESDKQRFPELDWN